MKTLNCMHVEDWMCPACCKCGVCCKCDEGNAGDPPLVHVNSLAAANAWRLSVGPGLSA